MNQGVRELKVCGLPAGVTLKLRAILTEQPTTTVLPPLDQRHTTKMPTSGR